MKHHALQGSVVREGKPMAAGVIQFVPSNGGPAALTAIADGKYAFTEQNGPVEGEQVVTITRTLERESVPEGTPKKDADFIPETGFNSTMPAGGWQLTTTVSADHNADTAVDFDVDKAVAAAGAGARRDKR